MEHNRQFRRDGADVHTDIQISIAQSILGGKIQVQGVYENMLVNVCILLLIMLSDLVINTFIFYYFLSYCLRRYIS